MVFPQHKLDFELAQAHKKIDNECIKIYDFKLKI